MNDISCEVYRIISEMFGVSREQLQPELPIRSIPNVESIKVLNVILKVEKLFDVEIPDEATFRTETIGEFDQLVQNLCAQRTVSAALL
ncbi:MAG: acyl carrier protein [Nitrospiraceae bacterium]